MITQDQLKEVFDYDPETGDFIFRTPGRKRRVGEIAGSPHVRGYWALHLNHKHILAHRAAMLWMTGEMPKEVDHIDGNRLNNRFSNLRAATNTENRCNTILRRDNALGIKGVRLGVTKKQNPIVIASIQINGKVFAKNWAVKKHGVEEATRHAKEWLDSIRAQVHGDFACDGRRP